MRVLGIEGTAWAASVAVFDTETDDVVRMETEAYRPDTGGIHPREAAEHMADAIPRLLGRILDETAGIDGVAFSRGPGLGPCLRIVATAARTLAQRLDVPLIGVNHMVAHLEIGRHRSGFEDPICLNASGANAHVLGYRDGRYRVLGETMDTGVGNAIDKFTRHLGWSHPGGPKVERAAEDGSYVELPYVVKGMDFSFSGIMSAAKAAVDEGERVEDVCFSLQETIFGMLAEVSERALSLTGNDHLVLGGGVGQNRRLQEMLAAMCEDRDASFFAPESRFLRDNGGMIAALGATMLAAGETLEISASRVDPNFRPDQVSVTWRSPPADGGSGRPEPTVIGAEAIVTIDGDRVVKRRAPKRYRHPELDARLRRRRTVQEARLTSDARRVGVPTPVVLDVDPVEGVIAFEYVGDADLLGSFTEERIETVGASLARLHDDGIVHGDPTPRNVRIDDERTYLIDFGLGFRSRHVEDHAMDLHVLLQGIDGTTDEPDRYRDAVESGYLSTGRREVLDHLNDIEARGRYR